MSKRRIFGRVEQSTRVKNAFLGSFSVKDSVVDKRLIGTQILRHSFMLGRSKGLLDGDVAILSKFGTMAEKVLLLEDAITDAVVAVVDAVPDVDHCFRSGGIEGLTNWLERPFKLRERKFETAEATVCQPCVT